MVRWLLVFLGVIIGAVIGAGGMLVAFPFLFPPPVVAEKAPDADGAIVVGTFQFDENAPGRDAIHWANGSGSVYRTDKATVIHLGETFEAGPGPNYWVYLNTVPVGAEEDFNADAGRRKLAPLKSFRGSQNFLLPPDVRIEDFRTVSIWCETFGVYIGSAALPSAET